VKSVMDRRRFLKNVSYAVPAGALPLIGVSALGQPTWPAQNLVMSIFRPVDKPISLPVRWRQPWKNCTAEQEGGARLDWCREFYLMLVELRDGALLEMTDLHHELYPEQTSGRV
jgi:hypothetical protein